MEKVITSLTVLLTGFVVVFLVLLLLIGIIVVYGRVISALEKQSLKKEVHKKAQPAETQPTKEDAVSSNQVAAPDNSTADSLEIIAVIAAAVDAMYGEGASKRIKSVKKASTSRSAWGNAGVLQNTRPF